MLRLQQINKSFPGAGNKIINSINLHLHEQDFCMVLGANGSGKSTLMKLISGAYTPDSGIITCNGNVAK